ASKLDLKMCFDDIMKLMDNPRGVHPKMAKILDDACGRMKKVGRDIAVDAGRRKNPRTWRDNNSNTMYLD
ncbi:hypothetical protein B0H17DRAFT_944186, partial [Mycena rosella]